MTEPFTPEQRDALCRVVDTWPDSKLVLIGAAALGCHVSMTWRRTNDIDVTIVADIATVTAQLRAIGFTRDPKREHRWRAHNGVVFDVLPVTRDAIARRELEWPESGFVMTLPAFDLLLVHTIRFEIDPTHSIDVATIPTIVVLKMAAWQDQPYEELLRYCARPPISDERLRIEADVSILLRLKTPWKDGSTHIVYEPLDFIAKLAALVPRPHKNLVVYHGVLAANAAWRSRVVAYGRQGATGAGGRGGGRARFERASTSAESVG
jgi:hypothetical protein